MIRKPLFIILTGLCVTAAAISPCQGAEPLIDSVELKPIAVEETKVKEPVIQRPEYTVGIDDVLEISVLQPDEIIRIVNVSPDGMITFPYIGSLYVKGLTIPIIQAQIRDALSDGFMNFPVVLVSLQESRSRKFFVYGEVKIPGDYPLEENTTVLRAVSMAGGFTKFGSSSRVKLLRPKANGKGYTPVKIDIKQVMNGNEEADMLLKAGDMIVVSEGVF